MHSGSCLCGAIRYEVAGPFDLMAHCHCSMCRKHHGAMFSTFVSAPLGGFKFLSGQDNIAVYPSSEHGKRPFCRTCGSVAPMTLESSGIVILPAGNLEGDPGVRPQMHMFAASHASWYPISDALPQHPGYPPQFGGGDGIKRPQPVLKLAVTQGSCLCGAVGWEFDGPPERVQNCHCSRCRRARSAAHATNAFYKAGQLAWTQGQEQVKSFPLPGAKHFAQDFCGTCGSPVPRVNPKTGYVVVPCGSLDSSPGLRPIGHLFVANKAPWFEITDGLPQHEAYPPRA